MSEVKLFGKMIQLPSNDDVSLAQRSAADLALLDCDGNSDHNNLSCSDGSVSPKSIHDKSNAATDSKQDDEEDQSEGNSSQETPLKKPDKILPCPRCNSMDTKFCYFNNYNVNQPRHFCKGCQRYWTAGGAIRNVPVGSGRRKAKTSPHPHPIVIPDTNNGAVYIADTNSEAQQFANNSFHGGSVYPAAPWYPASYTPIFSAPPFWGPWPSPGSPLGKHSREEERKVLVPKTLRIDDPNEAAKSSIWATLGIRNGVFGGFQTKGGGEGNSAGESSLVLQANPAAFSRSLRFHESAE